MAVIVKRIEPLIYSTTFSGSITIEDISGYLHETHAILQQHDEYDTDYVIIYQNDHANFELNFNIPLVRRALANAPKIRSEHSIFVDFSPALRLITTTMHRVITRKGELYFLKTEAEAIAKARTLIKMPQM